MNAIIFDSGALITLSMTGNLHLLRDLKKKSKVRFLITKKVEQEVVINSMKIKNYKLGAMRIRNLIDTKVLEFPESFSIKQADIERIGKGYLKKVNSCFFRGDRAIHLIDDGEASVLALSHLLSERGIENIIAIDERTTRIFFEKPENLHALLERKLHTKIEFKKCDIKNNFKFVRSVELIYIAYRKGIISKNKELLDAMLYAAKAKGCAISNKEIKEIESL